MEPEALNEEPHVVSDPEAARYLLDDEQRRSLEVFLGRDRSLSEAAAELGLHLNTMHYRVQRLLALGLVRVVREKKRAGRSIKVYRTIADVLRVPLDLAPDDTLERFLVRIEATRREEAGRWVARRLQEHADDWDLRISRDSDSTAEVSVALAPRGHGASFSERVLESEFPALLWQESMLELPYDQAKRLQRDLATLLARYEENARPGATRYLVKIGLVRTQD